MDEYGKRKEDCGIRAKAQQRSNCAQDIKKCAQEADSSPQVENQMLWKIKDWQNDHKQETIKVLKKCDKLSMCQEPDKDNVDEKSHISLLCNEDGLWLPQQGIREHLGSKHGEFFEGRCQDFSAQESKLGNTQRVSEGQRSAN